MVSGREFEIAAIGAMDDDEEEEIGAERKRHGLLYTSGGALYIHTT